MKLNCPASGGMYYHLDPSLTVANVVPHTLGTLEKHSHLGGQSFPSGKRPTCIIKERLSTIAHTSQSPIKLLEAIVRHNQQFEGTIRKRKRKNYAGSESHSPH